jgi:hypothetical protein
MTMAVELPADARAVLGAGWCVVLAGGDVPVAAFPSRAGADAWVGMTSDPDHYSVAVAAATRAVLTGDARGVEIVRRILGGKARP